MKRPLVIIAAAIGAAAALAAGTAEAAPVSWSIGVNLPPVATYVSGGPAYAAPAPVYRAPRRVWVEPAPVYAPAPNVYYREPYPVSYAPEYVYPAPVYAPRYEYRAPVVVAPRRHVWLPPLPPLPRRPRPPWEHRDNHPHSVDYRR